MENIAILWAFLISILICCTTGFTDGTIVSADSPHEPIRVVIDNAYPPFSFLDQSGNLQGITIDQWRLWENKTNVPVHITGLSWGEALARMKAGEFDVIDTIFYTKERAALYDFTPPYADLEVPIFYNNNISGIAGPTSLGGFVVAAKSGDAAVDYLKSHGVTLIREYPDYESIIRSAQEGDVVVFCIDKPPAQYFMYKYGIARDFQSTNSLYTGQFHRAVHKGSPLLNLINEGFSTITPEELRTIDEKWYGKSERPAEYLKYLVPGAMAATLMIALLGLWIYTLRITVRKRTDELQRELSVRKRTETGLEHALRKLNLFNRLIRSEINAKVFLIEGYHGLLLQDSRDVFHQDILSKCSAITKSLENLLDSARRLSDIGEQEQTWNDLEEAFIFARSHHPVETITFHLDLQGLKVLSDPVFEYIFSILIHKSLISGSVADTISCSVEQRRDSIALIYRDNTSGTIPDDDEQLSSRLTRDGIGNNMRVIHEILTLLGMEFIDKSDETGGWYEILIPGTNARLESS
ncbi:MAG TPA: transporter substrate-binding domain-containing protein [Methanospirillum sp.]|nr:transporter substrate-binding domain-containing protein [Methanospirillum sp.]